MLKTAVSIATSSIETEISTTSQAGILMCTKSELCKRNGCPAQWGAISIRTTRRRSAGTSQRPDSSLVRITIVSIAVPPPLRHDMQASARDDR
eukprot:scaffold193011_cov22-Prasinocladus_malaysianus.AAC.1